MWRMFTNSKDFPIRVVQVYSDYTHLDKTVLQETITPYVDHGFFNVDIKALNQTLKHLPWVAKVSIRRLWPNQIRITILPKRVVARWGDQGLLSAQGKIFYPDPSTFPSNLVVLVGPDNTQAKLLWQLYQQMVALLQPLGLTVTRVVLTDRHAWQLQLSDGVQLMLGRADLLDRLQRFIAVYPKIIQQGDVAKVDLRYSSGVAVQFKKLYS